MLLAIYTAEGAQSHKISEDYPERRASASNILASRRRPGIKRRAERNDCLRGFDRHRHSSLETIAARKHSQGACSAGPSSPPPQCELEP